MYDIHLMQTYTHELVVLVKLHLQRHRLNRWVREVLQRIRPTRLWNQLPTNLKKEATTVASFRKALQRHFLTNYDEVENFSPNAIVNNIPPALVSIAERGGSSFRDELRSSRKF